MKDYNLLELVENIEEKINKLKQKLAIAIKALEYYSHPERKRQVEVWEMSLLVDRGDIAREALEKINV